MHENMAKTLLDSRCAHHLLDLAADIDRRAPLGLYRNRLLFHHPAILSPANISM
jgi:hypothetical protein